MCTSGFLLSSEGNRNPVHHGRKSVLALDFADGFMFLIIDFDCISLSRHDGADVLLVFWQHTLDAFD